MSATEAARIWKRSLLAGALFIVGAVVVVAAVNW